jgi:uncharacterized membrane protein
MELWQILCMGLITPLIFIVLGLFTRLGLPRKVNFWIGYRTPMSCKNQDTWFFAHRHAGKLWISLGFILLVLSIGAVIVINNITSMQLTWMILVQLFVVLISLIPTEIALRKEFDKNGEHR